MDLTKLPMADLRNLHEQVNQEMKKRDEHEVARAREQIFAIAHSLGMPLKELIGTGIRPKSGKIADRFRHPENSAEQWSGRGRRPRWIKNWIDAGKTIDMLRVR